MSIERAPDAKTRYKHRKRIISPNNTTKAVRSLIHPEYKRASPTALWMYWHMATYSMERLASLPRLK